MGPDEPWLRQTMRLAYEIARQGDTLCTSVGTLGYEAALFGAAMAGGRADVFVSHAAASAVARCLPSKTLPEETISLRWLPDEKTNADVLRDRAVIDAADLAIAMAVRAGGQMESLLRARFDVGLAVAVVPAWNDDPMTRGNVRLARHGVPFVEEHLLQRIRESSSPVEHAEPPWDSFFPEWKTAPLVRPTLSHFTRAADGPWPGQTRAEYLEDLWLGGARARRDASAALQRMLRMSALTSSARLIRGGHAVVSFTAATPERIQELHRYRPHLVRWDFEPWGIVFDREWLIERKARPVHYLPSASLRTLAASERPYFQKHEPPTCDYSMEQEWRILGDFDFSDAPHDVVRIVTGP